MYLGTIGTRQCAIAQLVRKIPSQAQHLIFVSEAGPCGSWLYRYLTKKAYDCWAVAPSLLPQKPGDRVTTDRWKAVQLARLARSGDRTAVDVPKIDGEAMRALTRARADTSSAQKDAQLRLKACVLRHEMRSGGRANGGPAPLRWLSEVLCPPPAPHSVLHAYVRAVPAQPARLQRLAQARHAHGNAWRVSPVLEALQALRGVQGPGAVPLGAARGARTRCDSPRARMPWRGLLPAAYASGAQRRQGAMTTAGHPPARRVWVAGAWAYRSPAQGRRPLHLRREPQPPVLQDSRGQAQSRRGPRSRRLGARGTHANGVTGAMARKRRGFRGAMAQEGPGVASDHDGS